MRHILAFHFFLLAFGALAQVDELGFRIFGSRVYYATSNEMDSVEALLPGNVFPDSTIHINRIDGTWHRAIGAQPIANFQLWEDPGPQFGEPMTLAGSLQDLSRIWRIHASARANHTGTQPVETITGLADVAISGSYDDLSDKPAAGKRVETYSGTTNSSGVYTVTFSNAFSAAPNIQASITNQGTTNQFIRVTDVSTTGFTINVFQRSAVTLLGIEVLLAATTNVNGATVDVLVTEK